MELISSVWQELSQKHLIPQNISKKILEEILNAYSHKKRHYHNLTHITDLLQQAQSLDNQLDNKDIVYFSVFFHDIVYHASKSDNEEKSALFAQKTLRLMNIDDSLNKKIYDYILATKKHQPALHEPDLQFFLDIDLSILASEPARYQLYTEQIRKEYSIYPDFLYKSGRKKALLSFLERERIFYFYNQEYESRARENIKSEISRLG